MRWCRRCVRIDFLHRRGLKGYVRLLSNTAAMTEFLPEALSAFLAAHPEVDIDLEELVSHEIVEAIAQGRADIGIVNDAVDLSGLQTFPFRHDRLVLVTHGRVPGGGAWEALACSGLAAGHV